MTVYHVWLTGQEEPTTVEALAVAEHAGWLFFYQTDWFLELLTPNTAERSALARPFAPHEWRRWAEVHDEADTVQYIR